MSVKKQTLCAAISVARAIVVIILLGVVVGICYNYIAPAKIPWVEDWENYVENKAYQAGLIVADLTKTRQIIEAGTHLVFDARIREEYDAGHIPTALSLPLNGAEESITINEYGLFPEQPVMTYCSGQDCDDSLELCLLLQAMGYTNLTIYVGGWTEWEQAQ